MENDCKEDEVDCSVCGQESTCIKDKSDRIACTGCGPGKSISFYMLYITEKTCIRYNYTTITLAEICYILFIFILTYIIIKEKDDLSDNTYLKKKN